MDRVWFEFAIALLVIGFAGTRLARFGDAIADKTGLGGTWVGLMLVATVTSLPELVTSLSAVALADEPDIAVGAVLGSCVFNLAIFSLLDVLSPGASIFARVRRGHERAGLYGIVLVAVVACGILVDGRAGPLAGTIGFTTPVVFVLYALCLRSLFRVEKEQMSVVQAPEPGSGGSLREAVIGYWLAAMAVIAVGLWLPFVAADLAVALRVEETFVGTLLVAFATSLPEVAVTVAALRIGAVNMAVSNVLGSNLFNLLIVVPGDLFYAPGPLLGAVSRIQLVSALSTVLMTLIVIAALRRPPERRLGGRLSGAGLALVLLYLANGALLYLDGR
ncbi:MAG: sodium:calcium antiporter [Myxococcota bacterium]|nr:sodium:calcium antiporter [Myxococcota bacterium]